MKNKLAKVKLGEVLIDFTKKNKQDENICVYSVTNDLGFVVSTEYFSKEVFSKNLKTYKIVEEGDFAYNPSRVNVGSIDYFKNSGKGLISPLYVTFKTKNNLNRAYLKFYLKSPYGNTQIRENTSGSVRDTLSFKQLSRIHIPLPSNEEQERIVKILDNADTIRKKRKTIVDLLDNYMDSVFFEMFGSPESNIKKIAVRTVEDVASKEKHAIKAGPFGSSLKKEFYVKSGYKIYGQEQVIKNDFNYGDYYINEEKYKSLESCKIKSGDILISLVGSFGKISVVPEKFEPGIINPRLMKITSDQNIIYPEFLKEILSSKSVQQQIKNVSHGGTMGIVNVGIIKKIKIMVPKIDDQKLYLDKKEAVENLKQKMLLQSEEMEKLFQVLMQKAFKGEL